MLAAACERDLGNPDLWFEPDGYPHPLALCIIDSIYPAEVNRGHILGTLGHNSAQSQRITAVVISQITAVFRP